MKNIGKYTVVMVLIALCTVYLFKRCPLLMPNVSENEKSISELSVVPEMEISEEIRMKVKKMSLEEKLYQMFYVTPEQLTGVGEVIQAGNTTKENLEKYPVGGLVYRSHNLQTPEQTRELLSKSQEYSKIPMFLGVFEEGGSNTVIGDNDAMSLGEIEAMAEVSDFERAYDIGKLVGEELYSLGFNMNFAPVSDVIGDDVENVIGDRSFGNDYNAVSKKVEQYVKGLQGERSFRNTEALPGQGYTVGGTELDYADNKRTADEIKTEEFAPFKKGIEAGADFVMMGNITAKALDKENPATFSYKIVTELLKNELGFTGVVISSPLNDGAVLNSHTSAKAAVEAVKAGVDMLLMPNDLGIAFDALYEAVRKGEISEERIEESVMKILQCKANKGLL